MLGRLDINLRCQLDGRIASVPRLESLGSGLSLSWFQDLPPECIEEETINTSNREILARLVAGSRAHLAITTLDQRSAFCICIMEFRTTRADMASLAGKALQRDRMTGD